MTEKRMTEALQRGLEAETFTAESRRAVRQAVARRGGRRVWVAALAWTVLLLALGVSAAAMVRSRVLEGMYGAEESAPPEVAEKLVQDGAQARAPLAAVTLDEYLDDGKLLRLSLTLANPTDRQYVYMLTNVNLVGVEASISGNFVASSRLWGQVLGGAVEGVAMPSSLALDWEIEKLGEPEGRTATLTMNVEVWEPVAEPMRVGNTLDWGNAEYARAFAQGRLPVHEDGWTEMDKFMMDRALYEDLCARGWSREACAEVYERVGWMRYVDEITCTFDLRLDEEGIPAVRPAQTVLENEAMRVEIQEFDYKLSGGAMTVRLDPKGFDLSAALESARAADDPAHPEAGEEAMRALYARVGLGVFGADGAERLADGLGAEFRTDEAGRTYLEARFAFRPTARLPERMLIVPNTGRESVDLENALSVFLLK